MKRERLHLSKHQTIETYRDYNGRHYVAYSGNASVFISTRKELLRFLKIAKNLPMRASLDSWLDSLEAADADRSVNRDQPLISEEPIQQTSSNLSQELLATGFGPECHSDDEDPTANTRTII